MFYIVYWDLCILFLLLHSIIVQCYINIMQMFKNHGIMVQNLIKIIYNMYVCFFFFFTQPERTVFQTNVSLTLNNSHCRWQSLRLNDKMVKLGTRCIYKNVFIKLFLCTWHLLHRRMRFQRMQHRMRLSYFTTNDSDCSYWKGKIVHSVTHSIARISTVSREYFK